MTNNHVLIAIFLGLSGILPAIGCEKQPYTRVKIDNIVRYGCAGTCGGLGLGGMAKLYYSGACFSQEDLQFFGIAGGIGLFSGISYGVLNDFENRPRMTTHFHKQTIQKTYLTLGDALKTKRNSAEKTIIE